MHLRKGIGVFGTLILMVLLVAGIWIFFTSVSQKAKAAGGFEPFENGSLTSLGTCSFQCAKTTDDNAVCKFEKENDDGTTEDVEIPCTEVRLKQSQSSGDTDD